MNTQNETNKNNFYFVQIELTNLNDILICYFFTFMK